MGGGGGHGEGVRGEAQADPLSAGEDEKREGHYTQREYNKLPFTRNTTGTVAFPVSSWSSPTGTGDRIG